MEKASYNQLSEITGKTHRTLKKLLAEACVYPVEVRTNAIFFNRLEAIVALELPEGDQYGINLTPLVFMERVRAAWHDNQGSSASRKIREEIDEGTIFVQNQIWFEIGHIPAHLIKEHPHLMLTDEQIENNVNPFAPLRVVLNRFTDKLEKCRLIRIRNPPADPYIRCQMTFDRFAATVTPGLDALPGEISALGMDLNMSLIKRRIANARTCLEDFRRGTRDYAPRDQTTGKSLDSALSAG